MYGASDLRSAITLRLHGLVEADAVLRGVWLLCFPRDEGIR
jgi:hypothetical protein